MESSAGREATWKVIVKLQVAEMSQFPFQRSSKVWLIILLLSAFGGCRSRMETITLQQQIKGVDPRLVTNSSSEKIEQLIFNSLTRINGSDVPVPDLAESFTVTPDWTTHTFRLRAGVRFHNDHRLTSLDVKYTFETMFALEHTDGHRTRMPRRQTIIEVPDALTVQFKCLNPCPDLTRSIATVGIIPEGTSRLLPLKPVGTGPYRLQGFDNSGEFSLWAHEGYFAGRPKVERIVVQFAAGQ
jgi:peptide/nickel transport system substrate-binding protein